MKFSIKFFLLILIIIYENKCNEKYLLKNLSHFADVLNIEGGTIAKKLNYKQKWFNIGTVLDRPFIDGIELDDWTKNNKFYLKECSIPNYNELQTYFAHVTIIDFLINNAHKICNKKTNEQILIIVRIHRGSSGIKYLNLLSEIIEKIYPKYSSNKLSENSMPNELFSYKLQNLKIKFCYGYDESCLGIDSSDIVLSLSLVAGLNPQYKSGDLIIPVAFIPINLDSMILDLESKYFVKNYLLEHLNDILNSQSIEILNLINANFRSCNENKLHHKAKLLTAKDFNIVNLLQVNKNFNPSQLPNEFSINKD